VGVTPPGTGRPGTAKALPQAARDQHSRGYPARKEGRWRYDNSSTLSDRAQTWLIGASAAGRNELHLGAPNRRSGVTLGQQSDHVQWL